MLLTSDSFCCRIQDIFNPKAITVPNDVPMTLTALLWQQNGQHEDVLISIVNNFDFIAFLLTCNQLVTNWIEMNLQVSDAFAQGVSVNPEQF